MKWKIATIRFEPIDWLLMGLLLVSGAGYLFCPIDLVSDLSATVFIGSFLGLTLDQYMRHKAVEHVKEGVAPYFLTYPLPETVTQEIINFRDIRWVRQDHCIEYSISQSDTWPGYLIFETEISYTVVNYDNNEIVAPVRANMLGGGTPARSRILELSAQGTDDLVSEYHEEFPAYGEGPPEQSESEDITVQPNADNPNNRFRVRTWEVFPDDHVDIVFLTKLTVNSAIHVRQRPSGLNIQAKFGHTRFKQTNAFPPNAPTRWELDAVFLPWSAVYLEWEM